MKLIGKRGKIFRELLKQGLSKDYAQRISKGLSEGKTTKEARGKHPAERYHKRVPIKAKVPKSRLDKKKEEWALYSYFDGVQNQGSDSNSEILGITSYDLTKTLYKNYSFSGQKELFLMHQHMERQVQYYLKLELNFSSENEINVEDNTEYKTKHRRFLWQLTDFTTGEIRFHLIYEKGQIIEREMWEDFDYSEFKLEIRALGRWE